MPTKRFTPEQIIGKLRHTDVLLTQGTKVAEIVKALGIADPTYFRWRHDFCGLSTAQAKRLKKLDHEDVQFRKTVADLTLDKLIFQDAAKGNL